jgi:hypothetical protein
MTFQGPHRRLAANDIHRVFAVTQVRLDSVGHIRDLWWAEVNAKTNVEVGASASATVAEAVAAIHAGDVVVARFPTDKHLLPGRRFVLLEHGDGIETIALEGLASTGSELADLAR